MSKKVSIRNRPKLPPGISYHETTTGMKFRIRIRSIKKLERMGRVSKDKSGEILSVQEVDEVHDTRQQAEVRLHNLIYSTERGKEIGALIEQIGSHVFMHELLQTHYDKQYAKRPTAKQLQSRINVINKTVISGIDHRPMKFLGQLLPFAKNDLGIEEQVFGNALVKDYKTAIEQLIETRLYKDEVKPQTLNNDLTIISSALKNAHHYYTEFKDEPIIQPLVHVDKRKLEPVLPPKTDKRLTESQRLTVEKLLIEKSTKDHYHEFFIFLLESGCRLSEALGIQANDVDVPNRTIRISTLKRKNQSIRFIGITNKMLPIVKKHFEGKRLTDRLFQHSKHTYGTKLKQMKKHFEAAGVSFHWHKTRHTFASNNASSKNAFELSYAMGINDTQHLANEYLQVIHSENLAKKKAQAGLLTPEELQTYLGHRNQDETQNTYVHLDPEQISPADLLGIIKHLQSQVAELSSKIDEGKPNL